MRWRAGLAAPLALLGSLALAETPAAWPSGIYSDVRMSKATGDLGGFEARFYEDGDRHMVEFVFCEGWCNETFVAPVAAGPNGFTFDFKQTAVGAEGEIALDMHVVVRPVRGGLDYAIFQGGENVLGSRKLSRLRPVSKPFGLAVAKSGKD